ncbi:MAG: TIGR00282 family metallophosphoesterase [Candidatus Krumholzibacteria bacterium]|nr:TIGR00282 family metallophosphoesterase [Candidatus Krumholzibacteria bacterium]
MRIVFIGDVVGRPGRRAVAALVPRMRAELEPDLVLANAENSAGGFGIDRKGIGELESAGVRLFTTGNHVWDKPEGVALLDEKTNILRPANYPDAPGRGFAVVEGVAPPVAVLNVQGRVFMPPIDCPFRAVDRLLAELPREVRIVVVDVHAEATSEKIAMAWHLDGRASVVLGTHTHVPTADARVLPKGTGYVTDVGMTGSYAGVLGMKRDAVLWRFFHVRPTRFEVAKGDVRCDFVVADVDEESGRAVSLRHLQWRVEET